jgi:hypothetical protein
MAEAADVEAGDVAVATAAAEVNLEVVAEVGAAEASSHTNHGPNQSPHAGTNSMRWRECPTNNAKNSEQDARRETILDRWRLRAHKDRSHTMHRITTHHHHHPPITHPVSFIYRHHHPHCTLPASATGSTLHYKDLGDLLLDIPLASQGLMGAHLGTQDTLATDMMADTCRLFLTTWRKE